MGWGWGGGGMCDPLTLGGIILKILIILIQTQTNNTKKGKKSDSFKEDKRRGKAKNRRKMQ